MKDFTNYNHDVNSLGFKYEARQRRTSIVLVLVVTMMVFSFVESIAEIFNMDFGMSKEKYTITEIREMAEDILDEANQRGFTTRELQQRYISNELTKRGINTGRYYIYVDYYGNVTVEAK